MLNWNVSLSDPYLNHPAPGRKTSDFLYATGLGRVPLATTREEYNDGRAAQQSAEKTGLSPDQAKSAVESVLGFLKEKLPAPLASLLGGLVGGGENRGEAAGGPKRVRREELKKTLHLFDKGEKTQ